MDTTVFDAGRPIAMNLRTPEGVKTIRVRFPSDDEWIERQRRRKLVVKQLGRGASETTVVNREDADAALLEKIRVQGEGQDVEVDPFEATKIIEELATCDVDDVVSEGGGFRVTMRVLGGITTHVMKIPSAKDTFDYRRSFARVVDLQYGRQEVTVNIAPVGALYKRLVASTDGYEGAVVPIIHQAVAVRAAIDALDNAFAEDRDANFPEASHLR